MISSKLLVAQRPLAARCARAAAGDAGGRLHAHHIAENIRKFLRAFRKGLKERASSKAKTWQSNIGGRTDNMINCGFGSRSSASAGHGACATGGSPSPQRRKSRYSNNSYRVHYERGPREGRVGRSLSRPGGNVTGVTYLARPSGHRKRFQLMHELVPKRPRRRLSDEPDQPKRRFLH